MTKRPPKITKYRFRIKEHLVVPARELRPNPRNYRTHPPEQRAAMEAVLEEIGYTDELKVVRERGGGYMIIDGHMRSELDPEALVPVAVLDLKPEEADKMLASFDVITSMAERDDAGWAALLASLEANSEEFNDLLSSWRNEEGIGSPGTKGLTDPDALPPEVPTRAKRGDLWIMGPHRVLCGDSAIVGDVERLMAGERGALMVTDPPYGVAYGTGAKNLHWEAADDRPIANDDLGVGQSAFWTAAFRHWPLAGAAYIFSPSGPTMCALSAAIEAAGIEQHQWIVWVKQQFVLGRGHYHYRHEHLFYGWPKGAPSGWNGSRTEDSVWEADRPMRSPEHPTMKPVALCTRAIENSSAPGDIVLEPFLGSGTTLIAAEQTGRRCYAMELEPRYVDVAIRRWEEFTGHDAVWSPADASAPSKASRRKAKA